VAYRTCPRCHQAKPDWGSQSYCRECFREYKAERRRKAVAASPERACVICGTGFRSLHHLKLSCSKACARERERRLIGVTAIPTEPITCPVCSTRFTMRNSNHIYCSSGCTMIAHGKWSGNPRVRFTAEEREASRRKARAKWIAANPDYVPVPASPDVRRESVRRYRARKRAAPTTAFSAADVESKLGYWGNLCWMCGARATSLDHVKPLAKGGPHMLANFRPACGRCNSSKSNRWFGVSGLHRFIRST
jgi:5-methylcytosine-specific restriction endonuclease McrA